MRLCGSTGREARGPGRASRRLPPATNDAELGMAWWNGMTKIERLVALNAAGTTCPAEAWAFWKLRQAAADRH